MKLDFELSPYANHNNNKSLEKIDVRQTNFGSVAIN